MISIRTLLIPNFEGFHTTKFDEFLGLNDIKIAGRFYFSLYNTLLNQLLTNTYIYIPGAYWQYFLAQEIKN